VLPKVTDHFTHGDGQFLVMQFIAGQDLAELLALREQPFAEEKVLGWADDLLDALEELHSCDPPIVHRDIKPSNLKVTPKGRVLLLDFGLAKGTTGQMSSAEVDSRGKSIYGYTPHYAPLEQIRGAGTDPRSDLYSLGATLWTLLTNQTPPDALWRIGEKEEGNSDPLLLAHEINPKVSLGVSNVLNQAMSLNRKERPANAAELRSQLLRAGVVVAENATLTKASHSLKPTVTPGNVPPLAPTVKAPGPISATYPVSEPQIATIGVASPSARATQPGSSQAVTLEHPAKSRLRPLIGILFVLVVLGASAALASYFFFVKPLLENRGAGVANSRQPQPPPQAQQTAVVDEHSYNVNTKSKSRTDQAAVYVPPAGAVQFVNSRDNLDGNLAEHYVDFSFYYPRSWRKDPNAGIAGATNFARVERSLPPDFTQENFAVGWYSSAGSAEGDRAAFPSLAANLSAQFARGFQEYKKVSEGPTKAGEYDGYEFRFESVSRNTEHGDIKIWGRVVFLPPTDGGKNGVTLLMLATSLAPELRTVDDVGVKGELPMMLESFRFGK
jgi:serine/threonine protein kinase